jgi:hypothetical protein
MKRVAISAGIGVLAAVVLGGAYFAALYGGMKLSAPEIMIGAALLAFASSSAVFALLVLGRPAAGTPYQRTRLNEFPALQKISEFMDREKIQIFARPEQSLPEVMARYGSMFKKKPEELTRKIVVTLRASRRKDFNPVLLRALFGTLAPFKLEHVVLLDAEGSFAGYIPGARALKDFTGENGETKIAQSIVALLASPSDADALKVLKGLGGIPRGNTVDEKDNIRHAAALVYADDALPGLIVHKNLRPIGVISKTDLLILASAEPMIAGY